MPASRGTSKPHAASRSVAQPGKLVEGILDIRETWAQPREQMLSGLGWGNAPCRPRKQAHPYVLLQSTNRVAHGGRRHAQPFGGPCKAALLCYGEECGKNAEIVSLHL